MRNFYAESRMKRAISLFKYISRKRVENQRSLRDLRVRKLPFLSEDRENHSEDILKVIFLDL